MELTDFIVKKKLLLHVYIFVTRKTSTEIELKFINIPQTEHTRV